MWWTASGLDFGWQHPLARSSFLQLLLARFARSWWHSGSDVGMKAQGQTQLLFCAHCGKLLTEGSAHLQLSRVSEAASICPDFGHLWTFIPESYVSETFYLSDFGFVRRGPNHHHLVSARLKLHLLFKKWCLEMGGLIAEGKWAVGAMSFWLDVLKILFQFD